MNRQDHSSGDGLSRRDVIRGGICLGFLTLAGCQNQTTGSMPGPVSPNGPLASGSTPAVPGAIVSPTPAPVGSITVLPRAAWTRASGPVRGNVHMMGKVQRITVHHEGATFSATDMQTVTQRLESIRLSHINRHTKGESWADIGYHYVIDPAGRVWEGRSIQYQGAHVEDFNENNLGVMCMGNFDVQTPTPAQLATLQRFVLEQMHKYNVPSASLCTHRECPRASTRCPGENLERYMVAYRGRGGIFS